MLFIQIYHNCRVHGLFLCKFNILFELLRPNISRENQIQKASGPLLPSVLWTMVTPYTFHAFAMRSRVGKDPAVDHEAVTAQCPTHRVTHLLHTPLQTSHGVCRSVRCAIVGGQVDAKGGLWLLAWVGTLHKKGGGRWAAGCFRRLGLDQLIHASDCVTATSLEIRSRRLEAGEDRSPDITIWQ
jgi:hypothetical protein